MPTELDMPNGDVVTVPDGMPIADAIKMYKKAYQDEAGYDPDQKMKTPEEIDREAGEAALEAPSRPLMVGTIGIPSSKDVRNRVAAVGAGAANLGRNLAQMALPQSLEKYAGVSDEDMAKYASRDAPLEEAHPVSYMAGEIAPTLALPYAKAGTMLPRAIGEGAVFGAAAAGPENRTAGALGGALLVGALTLQGAR